jgi:integrase
MTDQLLLSKFNLLDMENYLDNLKAAGISFKAMRKSVKDIKHFLRRAKAVGLNPSMDMVTFDIRDHLAVLPQDDEKYYAKEVDINLIDENKVAEMLASFKDGFKNKDLDAINTFAIFCMLFFFGLRASELSGIKKDFHDKHSCVDLENNLLRIRGIYRDGKYINKTKNKGSKREYRN